MSKIVNDLKWLQSADNFLLYPKKIEALPYLFSFIFFPPHFLSSCEQSLIYYLFFASGLLTDLWSVLYTYL